MEYERTMLHAVSISCCLNVDLVVSGVGFQATERRVTLSGASPPCHYFTNSRFFCGNAYRQKAIRRPTDSAGRDFWTCLRQCCGSKLILQRDHGAEEEKVPTNQVEGRCRAQVRPREPLLDSNEELADALDDAEVFADMGAGRGGALCE